MNPPCAATKAASAVAQQWPEPLSLKEWDRRFPGSFDAVGLLAGAANVILQLSLLPIGHGVAESKVESGRLFDHPYKRFRTTISYIAVALLGTTEEKLAYRHAVNRQHAQVRSTPGAKIPYNAFDRQLQLWVALCIYYHFADLNQQLYGPLDADRSDELLCLLEPLGTTLQVKPEDWPRNRAEFESYWQLGLSRLAMDEPVRRYLTAVAEMQFLPRLLRIPAILHFTGGFLPAEVREAMHFSWSERDEIRFRRRIRRIAAINRRLPRWLRQAPYLLMIWDVRRRMRKGLPLV